MFRAAFLCLFLAGPALALPERLPADCAQPDATAGKWHCLGYVKGAIEALADAGLGACIPDEAMTEQGYMRRVMNAIAARPEGTEAASVLDVVWLLSGRPEACPL